MSLHKITSAILYLKVDVHMQVVKTPKRTPSFTTRRRTQSFRRHRRPDELPPVEIEGRLPLQPSFRTSRDLKFPFPDRYLFIYLLFLIV